MKQLKICVLEVDYLVEGPNTVVRIWGKTKKGKNILVLDRKFKPYFYMALKDGVSEEDIETLKNKVMKLEIEGKKPVKVEKVGKDFLGKPLILMKVTVNAPPDVPKFRSLVKECNEVKEEYEYSISFHKRYLIDHGIIPMGWIQVSGNELSSQYGVDNLIEADKIECLDAEGVPSLKIMSFDIELVEEKGESNIIMISMMDNKGFKKILTHSKRKVRGVVNVINEREMIKRFIVYVRKRNPDILVGYNSDRFDFQKISEAAEKYKLPLNMGRDESHLIFKRVARTSSAFIRGRVHVDLYDFIRNIMSFYLSTEVLGLGNVSKELVGMDKLGMSWEEIERAWKNEEIKSIGDYCLHDSLLALKLAENILPQIYELCRVVGQTLFDTSRMTYSQLVEWLLIRKAFASNQIVPNQPKFDEIMRRKRATPYEGGYVKQPKEGIHDKIALFDFQSLYPSITITHNVSPDTLNCDCGDIHKVPGEDYYFCRKENKKGFIPQIIEDLVEKRIQIKNKMRNLKVKTLKYKSLYNRQNALKILANASYGYYAYAGSRWYSRVCAQSITAWGRYYIIKVMNLAEKMRMPVIYGDTDSLFLKIKNKKQANKFLEKVNKSLPGVMELEFKDVYRSGIFVLSKSGKAAKKRYALIDYKGGIVIRGFEKVRRDWASIAKDTQEKVLFAVLRDRSPDKAVRIVRKIINDIKEEKVDKKLMIIHTQLTKPLSDYEQIGPHVSAAKKIIERGGSVKEGTTISFVITKGDGSISSRAEPHKEAKNYDPEYYIHNQVIPAALRVLSGLGCKEEDLLGIRKKQFGLEGFLKK